MDGPQKGSSLISVDWIEEHRRDPAVRLVEVDVSPAAYEEGHIPGAVLWNAYTDLRGEDYLPVGREELGRLLSRSGIAPGTTLVFYGYGAALGLWLMRAYGHEDVQMLDGSREQWAEAGYEWSTEAPGEAAGPPVDLPTEDAAILASRGAVEAAIDDPEQLLVDVRSDLEFDGSRFWPSGATEDTGRAGHIPGAVSVPIDLLRREDGSLKGPEELRDIFEERGVTPDRTLILYCTIGNRAAQAWFGLSELLGYPDVSVYYNSWVEWGKAAETPIDV
ncbi:MAG TPA: rhodanese-like domain-containing protein [Solirubrobacterales bacterium]